MPTYRITEVVVYIRVLYEILEEGQIGPWGGTVRSCGRLPSFRSSGAEGGQFEGAARG